MGQNVSLLISQPSSEGNGGKLEMGKWLELGSYFMTQPKIPKTKNSVVRTCRLRQFTGRTEQSQQGRMVCVTCKQCILELSLLLYRCCAIRAFKMNQYGGDFKNFEGEIWPRRGVSYTDKSYLPNALANAQENPSSEAHSFKQRNVRPQTLDRPRIDQCRLVL